MENRKMLKGTVRVSDVERICQANHERRKAEECEEARIATASPKPRNDRRCEAGKKRKCLRTVCTACMMFCGGGAAFAGMGISMGHWQTVVLGSVIAVVFLLTGCRAEGMLEEGRRDHG